MSDDQELSARPGLGVLHSVLSERLDQIQRQAAESLLDEQFQELMRKAVGIQAVLQARIAELRPLQPTRTTAHVRQLFQGLDIDSPAIASREVKELEGLLLRARRLQVDIEGWRDGGPARTLDELLKRTEPL